MRDFHVKFCEVSFYKRIKGDFVNLAILSIILFLFIMIVNDSIVSLLFVLFLILVVSYKTILRNRFYIYELYYEINKDEIVFRYLDFDKIKYCSIKLANLNLKLKATLEKTPSLYIVVKDRENKKFEIRQYESIEWNDKKLIEVNSRINKQYSPLSLKEKIVKLFKK
jgi:hypothetical protein